MSYKVEKAPFHHSYLLMHHVQVYNIMLLNLFKCWILCTDVILNHLFSATSNITILGSLYALSTIEKVDVIRQTMLRSVCEEAQVWGVPFLSAKLPFLPHALAPHRAHTTC